MSEYRQTNLDASELRALADLLDRMSEFANGTHGDTSAYVEEAEVRLPDADGAVSIKLEDGNWAVTHLRSVKA